jgi:Concanavalin A-like lectin/glucanases superfamily
MNAGSNFFGDDIRSRLSIRNQTQYQGITAYQDTNDTIMNPYVMAPVPPQKPREQVLVRMDEDDPYYQVMDVNPDDPNLFVCGDIDVVHNKKVPAESCIVTTRPGLYGQALDTNYTPTISGSDQYSILNDQGEPVVSPPTMDVVNYSKKFNDIPTSTYSPDYGATQYPSITPGFIRAVTTNTPTPKWATTVTYKPTDTFTPIGMNTTTPFHGTTRPYGKTTTPIIMNTPGITTTPSSKHSTKHASKFSPWMATTTPSVSSYHGATSTPTVSAQESSTVSSANIAAAQAAANDAAAQPVPDVLSNPFYSLVISANVASSIKTGDSKLNMAVPQNTKLGMYAVIGRGTNPETKRIIGFGSLVLNTPVENDYPENTTVQIYAAKPGTDAAKNDAKIEAALEKSQALSAPGIGSMVNTGVVDCKITGWDNWSNCGADGTRTRVQLSSGPQNGGATCPPLKTETDSTGCVGAGGSASSSKEPCAIIGWGDWTPCQTGSSTRTRTQITNGGTGNCPALQTEIDNSTCIAGCQYTGWTNWSTCVNGIRTRTQTTTGTNCNPQTQTDYSGCPINSSVVGWSDWSQCVQGSPSRTRTEITIPPKNGGWSIVPKTETDLSTCPVACSYLLDTDPRSPFYSCDPATATRVYTITELNPAINNGAPCTYEGVTIDSSSQLVPSIDKCPIDSYVTGWTDWTQCNVGSSLRTRTQVTRPPVNNGNTVEPIIQSDLKTCPVDCTFTLDFSNNVVCDQTTGKNKYKVKTFNPKVNGGADCSYNGTIITQLNQVVLSNIDCSVNCIASYTDGNDFCDSSFNYVRTYNVSKTSINEGNICAFSDPSYNVLIHDVSGAGTYSSIVDTCSDCSFTLTQVGCDFSTARKMFSVATYTPAVRKGKVCTYTDGTLITGVGQKFKDKNGVMQTYFVSGSTTDACPVDCSYGTVSTVPCKDPTTCTFVTYQLANYIPAKNPDLGAKCRYNGVDISVNMIGDSSQNATYQTNIGEPFNATILRDTSLKYRYRFLTADATNNTILNWASGAASATGSASVNSSNTQPLTQTGTYRAIFAGDNAASVSKICYTIDSATTTYNLTNGFTIAFWYYALPFNIQGEWLFNISTSNSSDGLAYRTGLSSFSGNNSSLQVCDQYNNVNPVSIPLNRWSHVTYMVDTTKNQIRIYINGFLVTTASSNVVTKNPLTNTFFYIGHPNSMQAGYYQEFLFYTRPLTEVEIRNLVSLT